MVAGRAAGSSLGELITTKGHSPEAAVLGIGRKEARLAARKRTKRQTLNHRRFWQSLIKIPAGKHPVDKLILKFARKNLKKYQRWDLFDQACLAFVRKELGALSSGNNPVGLTFLRMRRTKCVQAGIIENISPMYHGPKKSVKKKSAPKGFDLKRRQLLMQSTFRSFNGATLAEEYAKAVRAGQTATAQEILDVFVFNQGRIPRDPNQLKNMARV